MRSFELATTFCLASLLVMTDAAAQAPATAPRSQAPAGAQTGAPPRRAPGPRTAAVPARSQPIEGATTREAGTATRSARPGEGGPAAGPPQREPQSPFKLDTRQLQALDKLLEKWETANSKTNTFKCTFTRWEYDETLSGDKEFPKENENRFSTATGEIKYKKPDHGMFHVKEMNEWNKAKKTYEPVKDGLEHWVCDGKAIYEFVPKEKKLRVHPLPKEMQGEAIADGPVPFIFGAKADKMKQRYWMRERTPPDEIGKHIWLEIRPKYQHDAANFQEALLMLDDAEYQVIALQVTLPGGKQYSRFQFGDVVLNSIFSKINGDFSEPKTPRSWTKVVDPVGGPEEPPATEPARAAKRDTAPAKPPARR